jgi:hypothetical protein
MVTYLTTSRLVKEICGCIERQSNGTPFSCRERVVRYLQKPNDLAREAVGWNGGFGDAGLVFRL